MGGLDTLHIVFGASALRSVLGTAGIDPLTSSQPLTPANAHATLDGITQTMTSARKILDVNAAATAGIMVTFIPLLQLSSPAPAAVLMSSVAALVPPPTRGLYAGSKAAQMQIFQTAALEAKAQSEHSAKTGQAHRASVKCFVLAPGTIRTDFRLSAVDGPIDASVRDASWDKDQGKKSGGKSSDILEVGQVAHDAIRGADRMAEGVKVIPAKYKLVRIAQILV